MNNIKNFALSEISVSIEYEIYIFSNYCSEKKSRVEHAGHTLTQYITSIYISEYKNIIFLSFLIK